MHGLLPHATYYYWYKQAVATAACFASKQKENFQAGTFQGTHWTDEHARNSPVGMKGRQKLRCVFLATKVTPILNVVSVLQRKSSTNLNRRQKDETIRKCIETSVPLFFLLIHHESCFAAIDKVTEML
jgi:hypothetical protein